MSNTEKYLRDAFAGESQANRTYTAFAARADKEGYSQAAKLFRAAALAEEVHANNHLRALKAIKSTKENLQTALSGENHEWEQMYPEMIETAKTEGKREAEMSFHYANEVDKVHSQLYRRHIDNLASTETYPYFVCPYCGNTVEKEAPTVCQVCGAKGELFQKVT